MHRDLGKYDIGGPAPRTAAKSTMAEKAAHTIERWMMENADNVPLCRHVVTVDEILEHMPNDVQRSEKDPRQRIADVLTRKFKGRSYRIRLISKSGDRGKTTVWALRQIDQAKAQPSEYLRWLYHSERYTLSAADKAAHQAYVKKHAAEFQDS